MNRQRQCFRCGKWFYNHNGMMIYLPPEYDDRKCPRCNKEIEKEIKDSGVMDDEKI